uniref:chitinase n=1 Tax=Sparus aurata TaxID=8175 RepID=A0A671UYP1_SPAAU
MGKLMTSTSSTRLVCYYDSSAENRVEDGKFRVSDVDPNQCTHLIYAFSDINAQHELVPKSEADIQRYESFNGLKTRFSTMASTQQDRKKFIQSVITLLRANGQPEDKQRFTLLTKELKDAFEAEATDRERLIVTASVSAERAIINASYEVAQVAMHLDFINVLTFDFHGPWENVTGHHSPLYRGSEDTGDNIYSNTDSAMQYWQDQGAPSQKLNLGLATYGRAFTLSSASSNVGASASGAYNLMTCTTCLYLEDVTIQLIPDQKVPYATTENQWVGFDNKDSLDVKVSYLKTNNFGGASVWSMDVDDFSGTFCKQGNFSIISHLHALLIPAAPIITVIPCDGKNHERLPVPNDPTSYYNCAGQRVFVVQCDPGLVFNVNCSCCERNNLTVYKWQYLFLLTKHPTENC